MVLGVFASLPSYNELMDSIPEREAAATELKLIVTVVIINLQFKELPARHMIHMEILCALAIQFSEAFTEYIYVCV